MRRRERALIGRLRLCALQADKTRSSVASDEKHYIIDAYYLYSAAAL